MPSKPDLDFAGQVCEPHAVTNWYRPIRRSTPRRVAMKLRLTAAAGLVVLLSLAMASATGARIAVPQARQATDITVWLMGDAQSNWPEAVAAANQAFGQKHPGVNVKVQYQTWGDYKTKFEATLAAGNAPDVIEFGNTDTPKYTAAGALAPLDKAPSPTRAPGCRASPRRASTTARRTPSRTTRERAASSTGPTSTRLRGSSRRRSRSPSSWRPAAS